MTTEKRLYEVYRTVEIDGHKVTTIYGIFFKLDLANLFHYHYTQVSGFNDLYVRTVRRKFGTSDLTN